MRDNYFPIAVNVTLAIVAAIAVPVTMAIVATMVIGQTGPNTRVGEIPIVRLDDPKTKDPERRAGSAAELACLTAIAKKRGKAVEFSDVLYALPEGCPHEGFEMRGYGVALSAIPKLSERFALKAEYRKNLPWGEAKRLLQEGWDVMYRVGSRFGKNGYVMIKDAKHGDFKAVVTENTVVVAITNDVYVTVMDPVRGKFAYTHEEWKTALRSDTFNGEGVIFPPDDK